MNTHVVLKRIPGNNAEVNAEVDASEWRNARLLTEQRYLRPLDASAEPMDRTHPEVSFDQQVVDALMLHLQTDDSPLVQLLRDRLASVPISDTSQKRAAKSLKS